MDNFLDFTRFTWETFHLDLIFNCEKFKNLTTKREKFKYYAKLMIFYLILLNIIFYSLVFGTIMFQNPFDIKNIGDGLGTSSGLLLTCIEIFILFYYKEDVCEVLSKLPKIYLEKEFEKYNLRPLVSRTKIFYTLPGVWGFLATFYFIVKALINGEKKFIIDLKFPFDISHPVIFDGIILNMAVVITIYEIYLVVSQILKFGLISVTAVEFMKLRDEFKELRKKVRKNSILI